MVYAEFGGQTECIMGNWKIENCDYCTGCRNSHCQKQSFQDYVHPDYHVQLTYEINDSWVQTFHNTNHIQ